MKEELKRKEREDEMITPVLKYLEEKLNSEFSSLFLGHYKEGIPTQHLPESKRTFLKVALAHQKQTTLNLRH